MCTGSLFVNPRRYHAGSGVALQEACHSSTARTRRRRYRLQKRAGAAREETGPGGHDHVSGFADGAVPDPGHLRRAGVKAPPGLPRGAHPVPERPIFPVLLRRPFTYPSGPMPCGKKRKRHKIATHKRKKRLRKNRHKKKGR